MTNDEKTSPEAGSGPELPDEMPPMRVPDEYLNPPEFSGDAPTVRREWFGEPAPEAAEAPDPEGQEQLATVVSLVRRLVSAANSPMAHGQLVRVRDHDWKVCPKCQAVGEALAFLDAMDSEKDVAPAPLVIA